MPDRIGIKGKEQGRKARSIPKIKKINRLSSQESCEKRFKNT